MRYFSLAVLAWTFTCTGANAEDQSKTLDQEVLAKYIGSWNIQFDEDYPFSKGTGRADWILNEAYVEHAADFTARFVRHDLTVKILTTYDRNKKRFQRWSFASNGRSFESTGAWDPDAETMTWISEQFEPLTKATIRTTSTERFLADGRIEVVSIGKNGDRIVGQSTKTFQPIDAFANPPDTKSGEELQSTPLDGVWVLEAYKKYDLDLAGDRLPDYLHGHTRTFRKHQMTLMSKRGKQEFAFTVNDGAMPKEFDVLMEGDGERLRKKKAIYRIEDEVLQVAEGSVARPTSFEPTKAKQFSVYIYRRKQN